MELGARKLVFPVGSREASGPQRARPQMLSLLLASGVDVEEPEAPACPSCSGKFCLARGIWSSSQRRLGNEQAVF